MAFRRSLLTASLLALVAAVSGCSSLASHSGSARIKPNLQVGSFDYITQSTSSPAGSIGLDFSRPSRSAFQTTYQLSLSDGSFTLPVKLEQRSLLYRIVFSGATTTNGEQAGCASRRTPSGGVVPAGHDEGGYHYTLRPVTVHVSIGNACVDKMERVSVYVRIKLPTGLLSGVGGDSVFSY